MPPVERTGRASPSEQWSYTSPHCLAWSLAVAMNDLQNVFRLCCVCFFLPATPPQGKQSRTLFKPTTGGQSPFSRAAKWQILPKGNGNTIMALAACFAIYGGSSRASRKSDSFDCNPTELVVEVGEDFISGCRPDLGEK